MEAHQQCLLLGPCPAGAARVFLSPCEIATMAVIVRRQSGVKFIFVATVVMTGLCAGETIERRTLPPLAEGCCAGISLSFLCPTFSPLFPCRMRSCEWQQLPTEPGFSKVDPRSQNLEYRLRSQAFTCSIGLLLPEALPLTGRIEENTTCAPDPVSIAPRDIESLWMVLSCLVTLSLDPASRRRSG